MKLIFLLMIFLMINETAYSGIKIDSLALKDTVINEFDRYNDNFLGTWIAVHEEEIYELRLEKRMIYYVQIDTYTMMILGSIKKICNGKVIYDRKIPDTNVRKDTHFPLCGSPWSSKTLSMIYEEPGENKELGKVEFTLSDDKQTATWVLRGTVDLKIINIQKYERFEIPYEMTFKRKRDHEK